MRDEPGACPICGMALEPRVGDARGAEPRARRHDAAVPGGRSLLTVPLLAFMVSEFLPGQPLQHALPPAWLTWIAARARDAGGALGRLAVLRARLGVGRQPHLNMFTLIALGVGAAYVYSVVATLAPGAVSRRRSGRTAAGRASTSRPRRSSSRWCCSGRCWSCARAARRGAAIRRCSASRRRTARRVEADGTRRTCRSSRSTVGRPAARAARRKVPVDGVVLEGASTRRRVDGHRRADSGREDGRAAR